MDFDNDGVKDLILGNREGTVIFYKKGSDQSLQSGISLNDANGMIKVSNNSKPTVIDWNGDGLLDLIVSAGDTTESSIVGAPIRIYINEGSKENYKYGISSKLTSGGEVLKLRRCYSQIIDLNGDGLLDLVASEKDYENWGGNSKIFFFEKESGPSSFDFKERVALKEADGKDMMVGGDAHFCFADWNNNGIQDLIWTQYPGFTSKDFVYVSYRGGSVNTEPLPKCKVNNLKIYSNNKKLIIDSKNKIKAISIFDLTGKLLYKKMNPADQINISNLHLNKCSVIKISGFNWSHNQKLILK